MDHPLFFPLCGGAFQTKKVTLPPFEIPSNKQEEMLFLGGLIYHTDLLRMLTFIFCIYGANLSFMYLIYHPFSDREFIAIPLACVSKAKLMWIGFIFQSSVPLFTRKEAAPAVKCRATTDCPARALPGRISMNCGEPRGSRAGWRMSSSRLEETDFQPGPWAWSCWQKCVSLGTWGSCKPQKNKMIKPNQTETITRDMNCFAQMHTCIFPFPVSKARKQTVPYSTCNNTTLYT